MSKGRIAAAFLVAPLVAGLVGGPLHAVYLSIGDEPFFDEGFFRAMFSTGTMTTILGYIATILCAPVAIAYARKKNRPVSLPYAATVGGVVGAITPQTIPWVWFLQGAVGTELFFVYVGLGALAGISVACAFWLIAFSPARRMAAA